VLGKHTGHEIILDGQEYLVMREDDVLGVLDQAAKSTNKTS
jgi:chaperonin GroES